MISPLLLYHGSCHSSNTLIAPNTRRISALALHVPCMISHLQGLCPTKHKLVFAPNTRRINALVLHAAESVHVRSCMISPHVARVACVLANNTFLFAPNARRINASAGGMVQRDHGLHPSYTQDLLFAPSTRRINACSCICFKASGSLFMLPCFCEPSHDSHFGSEFLTCILQCLAERGLGPRQLMHACMENTPLLRDHVSQSQVAPQECPTDSYLKVCCCPKPPKMKKINTIKYL